MEDPGVRRGIQRNMGRNDHPGSCRLPPDEMGHGCKQVGGVCCQLLLGDYVCPSHVDVWFLLILCMNIFLLTWYHAFVSRHIGHRLYFVIHIFFEDSMDTFDKYCYIRCFYMLFNFLNMYLMLISRFSGQLYEQTKREKRK